MKRKDGRKIDPQTKVIYHSDFNPIPGDIKGFADKRVDLPSVSEEMINSSLHDIECNREKMQHFYSCFGVENNRHQSYHKISEDDISLNQTFEKIAEIIEKGLL